jgi:hypothetical protein
MCQQFPLNTWDTSDIVSIYIYNRSKTPQNTRENSIIPVGYEVHDPILKPLQYYC